MRYLYCSGTCQSPATLCLSSPSDSVKFCKLLSIVLSTWLTASGFIHLVSISSNPLMLLVSTNIFSVKTGANLPSSCLHHCNQHEVYLFTSFGWVFSIPYFSQACISYTHSIPVSSPSSQNLLVEKDLISSFI